jgi:MFS transporter, OFA family, oxalate/formate antiporter
MELPALLAGILFYFLKTGTFTGRFLILREYGWVQEAGSQSRLHALVFYGTKYYGPNYGLVFTAYGAGAVIGNLLAGQL